ncbi:beta-galactosidase/beta-glucuronidase [Desulfosporosinus orientis DSM 765]|uniref:Beta-galactosidase/beta-glucuronidase n=1 Tax=Desulfosporosinus orientis (strain ATCC 19365 / DSM 765 / NCIMB 8382 / VKM B-1628 / Singapore I) TaxID=768706 RepID=G7WHE4_DESOD|nr:glycosyl hydrolase [Desulfosporosinus orientis]AET70234.1 beta-galactosidase/beta-glucuronidase [Desulfosporosinus orientis DSM 765]
MFNRRFLIFIILWVVTIGVLWWNWSNSGGESLFAWQSGVSTARYSQNLNGSWNSFSSLRQAWTTESERSQGKNNQSFLTKGSSIELPSSERFSVATKRFQIPGEWSSRTMLLTLNGVQGHVNVYLNGITSSQKIGEFEGSGGADELEILPKAFRYGEDNILLVELTGSSEQRATLLGSAWPRSGFIKGDIRLDAVVETTLMMPKINVEWQDTTAQITVTTNVLHRGFAQEGPWTVFGVISDGSAGLAEQTLTVPAQESSDRQPVTLTFSLPNARHWTMEDPYLYQLHLTVTNSKGDLDDLSLPLGLRTMSLESGKWKLNGQFIKINGDALTPQEEYRLRNSGELESFLVSERQKGKNLIYFIGQLPDEIWLQTADKIGIGLWAELPVELIPSQRLPQADVFQTVISEKNLHPSLWAWTLGKGLNSDGLAQTYFQHAEIIAQPNLAFALTLSPAFNTGLAEEQGITIERTKIQGTWGEVSLETSPEKSVLWTKESIVAEVWAVLMIFLAWMNIRSASWRYKEIGELKPKRRLRSAWLWNGSLFLARMGMLAGLITSGLFRIPIHANPWFSHLWPGIQLLQGQSPWLLWAMFFGLLVLLKLLQIGVVVPHLPDNPHEIGLINWLERRFRWAVFVAIAWALLPWGIPFYVPVLGYILLVVLFLPFRIRDIHRIGGRYRPFLWVPGILCTSLLVWASFYCADWLYLWKMLQPMAEPIIQSIRSIL